MSGTDIYDLSISEKDFQDNEESIINFDYVYSMFQMEKILRENGMNTEDPKFIELADKYLDIDVAQIIDSNLHPEFDGTIENEDGLIDSRLAVLWKESYKNAKIGDEINGGKVIGIFTLTIWIRLNENTGHEYCCSSSCDCS